MKTFDIEIPNEIYHRGVKDAEEKGITFSELCSLGVLELIRHSDDELEAMSGKVRDANDHE